jgi:DNA-binding NarL/FixJ family response regulator
MLREFAMTPMQGGTQVRGDELIPARSPGRIPGNVHTLPSRGEKVVKQVGSESGLTAQEQCVLRNLMLGMKTCDIARAMFVSIHSVRKHIKGIYQKCSVNCLQELFGVLIKKLM